MWTSLCFSIAIFCVFFGLNEGCGWSAFSPTNVRLRYGDDPKTIETRNYPYHYLHNQNCYWLIEAPAGPVIGYAFSYDFELESDDGCDTYDYVSLYDSRRASNNATIGSYCGFQAPPDGYTKSNVLLVHFKSDSSVRYKGFRMGFAIDYIPFVSPDGEGSALPGGAIAAIVLCILVPLILVTLLIVVCCCCCKSQGSPGVVINNNQVGVATVAQNVPPAYSQYPLQVNQYPPPPALYPVLMSPGGVRHGLLPPGGVQPMLHHQTSPNHPPPAYY